MASGDEPRKRTTDDGTKVPQHETTFISEEDVVSDNRCSSKPHLSKSYGKKCCRVALDNGTFPPAPYKKYFQLFFYVVKTLLTLFLVALLLYSFLLRKNGESLDATKLLRIIDIVNQHISMNKRSLTNLTMS